MKVVIAYDLGEAYVSDLRNTFPNVDFVTAYTPEDELKETTDADVQFGTISREAFLDAKNLKWFQFIGIGFDGIVSSIPEIIESSVTMTLMRETHVPAISDHAMAMILAFAHRVPYLLEDQRAHRWDTDGHRHKIIELTGSTMGILAMGDLGKGVAQRARGFEMTIYGVDIEPMDPPQGVEAVWGLDRLDEMLGTSDWVVVTAPRTEASRGLIGPAQFERLKQGAHIIVVSRGSIVDEDALVEALRSGKVAGAALDATDIEPLPSESPLWDFPNVIISPHVSGETVPLWERRKEIFKENLRRYLAGEELMFVADKARGY